MNFIPYIFRVLRNKYWKSLHSWSIFSTKKCTPSLFQYKVQFVDGKLLVDHNSTNTSKVLRSPSSDDPISVYFAKYFAGILYEINIFILAVFDVSAAAFTVCIHG